MTLHEYIQARWHKLSPEAILELGLDDVTRREATFRMWALTYYERQVDVLHAETKGV